jgi:hypothetical protein
MTDLAFPNGFPLTIDGESNPTKTIEDALYIRACDHGILTVDLFDASLSARDAFRCTGLLPVLADYANHIIGRTLYMDFETEYQQSLINEVFEHQPEGVRINEISDAVKARSNRPALYNKANPYALLESAVAVREEGGTPLSVSLLMMDLALEAAIRESHVYQRQTLGDIIEDTLILTPVVHTLQRINAQPRIDIPPNLPARVEQERQDRSAAQTIGQHYDQANKQQPQGKV